MTLQTIEEKTTTKWVHGTTSRPVVPRWSTARDFIRPIAALVVALLSTACGGDSTEPNPPVASVTVSPSTATIVAGSTVQIEATTKDANGRTLTGRTVTWSSSDATIGTVDNTGLVTGVAEGFAIVTATSQGQSGTADITVTPAPVATVTVSPETATIAAGSTVQLMATLKDAAGRTLTGRTVTWSSSDLGIATVDNTGLVTGVAEGTATITATSEGQSGTASITVPPPPTFAWLDAGATHTCGVTPAGLAYCWGRAEEGQLGNGGRVSQSSMPVIVSGGLTFTFVGAGGEHSCGLTTGGAAFCWGNNTFGQLGDGGGGAPGGIDTPVAVTGGLTFASLTIGTVHTCGISNNGAAHCWGENASGQLGDGTSSDRNTPVPVSGGLTFAELNGGGLYTCGINTDSLAFCWGRNNRGQLGNGSTTDASMPVPVSGGLKFVSVSAGPEHTCALTAAGDAYCWGRGDRGQLGKGSTASDSTPGLVLGGLAFRGVSTGFVHTCGVTTTDEAYCWGWGNTGQLGNGSIVDQSTPVPVSGGLFFASVNAGSFHSCGITTGDIAYCWGTNSSGQLGDGSTTDRTTPARVAGQP